MSQSLNETKAVKSHNFYPAHYFAEAIQSDIKEFNSNSDSLKSAKKSAEAQLIELFELTKGSKEAKELRQQLIDSTYKAFGFYSITQDSKDLLKTDLQIRIQNRDYSIKASKRISLRGHGELWLFDANLDEVVIESESATETLKAMVSEHCFDLPGLVDFKGQPSWFTWKEIVSALYDCDSPHADWIIINAGNKIYLFEKAKWQEEESYLELNIQELFELNHDDTYKLAQALFSPNAFPINTADFFHEKIAHNAHKKASEVTKALRDTVRESIELIANAVIQAHKESPLPSFKKFNLKDDIQREQAANILFEQSLKFVYRMLFMLFTESQDHSKGSLPVNSKAYQRGYAMEKLRDLVDIPMQDFAKGHFIQQTLQKSFEIYFKGYHNDLGISDIKKDSLGFSFPSLGTTLFDPKTTPLIQEAKIKDGIMQQVLRKMSLASTGSGKNKRTQRVHYAGLGLNQLGAVYEGLLSLKPEILSERVILLEKEPKDLAHRYIAHSKKSEIPKDKLLVNEGSKELITKEKDEFLLTPAGLERKFSASFYTPEVLTRFVAKEVVDTMLEKDNSLEKLEAIKILEPAMGSGAFLNAVVDELAPRIAKFKEVEAKEKRRHFLEKNPNDYENAPKVENFEFYKLQAKAFLMKNSVYGVDLNPTATELAKVSLWLNCLHTDGNLPFMDFKLRLGNSLVGGWVKRNYDHDNLPHWFYPNPAALDPHLDGKILGDSKRPFLESEKTITKLKSLKQEFSDSRKDVNLKQKLRELANIVNSLYDKHVEQKRSFQEQLNCERNPVKKQEIFNTYIENNTEYNQLRFAMDIWCSLWFWPHSQIANFPTSAQFYQGINWVLNTKIKTNADLLDQQVQSSGITFLKTVRNIAKKQKFFHYDLEFAEVFYNGGFDIVLGNPPWAPVRWEEADFFDEVSPGIHDEKGSSKDYIKKYNLLINQNPKIIELYKDRQAVVIGFQNFLKNSGTYGFQDSSPTNTYKYFYQRFSATCKESGLQAIIAQDGIITDDGCEDMRSSFYKECKKLFRFHNFLKLFEDPGGDLKFCLWINEKSKVETSFELLDNLLHPSTIEKCKNESKLSPYKGMKNDSNDWELGGHPDRVVTIDKRLLLNLGGFTNSTDLKNVTLPIIHGKYELLVLSKLSQHSNKMNIGQNIFCSGMFHETKDDRIGQIARKSRKAPKINRMVMTGPNLFVGNPSYKRPNENCQSKGDFSNVDLKIIAEDYYPETVFEVTETGIKSNEYNRLNCWGNKHIDEYRIASRAMINTTGIRTLSSAIIPPGVSHIQNICSLSFKSAKELIYTQATFNSLIFDFLIRAITSGMLGASTYKTVPSLTDEQLGNPLLPALMVRALRLSCISNHYDSLWSSSFKNTYKDFDFESTFKPDSPYSKLAGKWTQNSCIRDPKQREQALCEIDAIVAIIFNFSKETLLNLYRSQFAVLQSNLQDLPNQNIDENEYHFPRYQAMSEAYDQALAYLEEKKKAKKTA